MPLTADEQRRLQIVEGRIAELTARAKLLEGERDRLRREQLDSDGASDKLPVAVR